MKTSLVCCFVALLAVQANGWSWPFASMFDMTPEPTPTSEPFPLPDPIPLEADLQYGFWEDIYDRAIEEYGNEYVPNYERNLWRPTEMLLNAGDSIVSWMPQWVRSLWFYGPSTREVYIPEELSPEDMINSSIHWVRKCLRLHDNPALLSAIDGSKTFRPIYILDPHFVQNGRVGANRWRFLMEALRDLDNSLKKIGSRLFVIRGSPAEVFPEIFERWGVTRLTFEVDTEPYSRQRDQMVVDLAKKHGVEVITKVGHTLFDTERVIKANGGKPPMTYQRMQGLLSKLGAPAEPEIIPSLEAFPNLRTPIRDDHDRVYGIPTLRELGVDESELGPRLYPGGETEGLARMEMHLARKTWTCNFEKPKTSPNSLEPSTTVLSPYLKFGCLSPRKFYYAIQDVYAQKTNCTKPPVSLLGQLLWREFFYTVAAATPNFDKMEENPICIQVPWENNTEIITAWKEGRTGYPFIDAIMTQLRTEGWIHHLARHATACFLTRGDLWQNWVEGQKIFEEWLLDADYSLNAGNWMWLSSSAFFHQYYRVYSPVAFGKKTDKSGEYIKKYLPVLNRMPAEYIYEPWKAPRSVQEAAGCIIGTDYPRPIVDHDTAMRRNMNRMKEARQCQPGKDPAGKRKGETSTKNPKSRRIDSMFSKK
ncbi:cryptochrome-2-like [Diadema antillarum]|uniref:cryptochrome-2-like n=1 Tax=Diadema antillarum TaxID=105358 RepID=UPI003A8356DF